MIRFSLFMLSTMIAILMQMEVIEWKYNIDEQLICDE